MKSATKKPLSILDRAFVYVPAAGTTPEYLRAKFKRIARELAQQKHVASVVSMKRAAK